MLRISKHRKEPSRVLRITLALAIAVMMVMSSMMPAYYSFAEENEGEIATQATTAAKAEEPKKEVKEEAPPAKSPESESNSDNSGSDQKEEEQSSGSETNETQATQTETQNQQGTEANTDPTDPTDPTEATEEEEEAMPAQSFSGSAGGVNVKASAGEGVFPEGTKMKVSSVSSSYVISAAKKTVGQDSKVVDAAAVDITFFSKGKEIQPADGSVSVSLSSRAIAGDEHEAVHVSGGSASIIGGASAGHASFRADHFSIYGIIGVDYEEPDVEQYARYSYIFKVNGVEVDRQFVRNGEEVTAPKDPADKWFKGWEIDGKITEFPLTAVIPEDETQDRDIVVNAAFEEVCRATFYKYDNNTNSILQVMEEKKGTTISTAGVHFEYEDGSAIIGWKEKGTGNALDQITLDRDYELVPIISQYPVQVTFATGEGTPIPPVFVDKGDSVKKPADPSRSGYSFTGWFTDEACKNSYNFNTPVKENLTLYAGWKGERTEYSVVYWKQNANDDNYTFVEMETQRGYAGEAATYSKKNYDCFTLNSARTGEPVIIKGDGTTIKNVYYDRVQYPLTFYVVEDGKWKEIAREYFKYEQDTSKFWKAETSEYSGYNWFVSKKDAESFTGGTIWADAKPMQKGGLEGWGKKGNGSVDILYVDEEGKEIRDKFTLAKTSTNFSQDYVPPVIPGFTFRKWENSSGNKPAYIRYKRNTYSMAFMTNGGKKVDTVKNIPFDYPLNAYKPSSYEVGVTTKVDNGITYTFEGWYDNEAYAGSPFNFNSKMPALEVVKQRGDKATLVLYAKWLAEEHTVSFDLAGGSYDGGSSIPAQAVESGKLATAPDSSKMEKDGSAFGYWTDEKGNRFSFDTRITKDYDLKAHWNSDNSKILKVVYDAGDGSGAPTDNTEYQEGSLAIIKGQPTAPEMKYFIGWKVGNSDVVLVGGGFQLKSEDAVNGKVTLTAQYGDKDLHATSITYNANGGTINGKSVYTDEANVNMNYTIISDIPVRANFTFLGWSTDANANKAMFHPGEIVAAGKDVNLRKVVGNSMFAVWKKNAETVSVTIDGKTDSKVYNAKEQKVEGFTFSVKDKEGKDLDPGTVNVKLKKDGSDVAKGTNVGDYPMGLSEESFEVTPATDSNYAIGSVKVNDGSLTIEKAEATVKITGHTASVAYDGKKHQVKGYDVSINNELYTEKDFVFTGSAEASGTEVGLYTMELYPSEFESTNDNFNVTFEVVNGFLEIKKTGTLPDYEEPKHNGNGGEGNNDNNGNYKKAKAEVKGDYEAASDTAVATGDNSPLTLCILLMLMALTMAAAVGIRVRLDKKA